MFRLIVLLWLIVFVMGDKKCPDIPPLDSFDLSKYAQGTWYELARFNNDFEKRGDCVSITHKKGDGLYSFLFRTVVNNTLRLLEGEIYSDGPGHVTLVAPALAVNKNTDRITINVLSVDYDKYAIAYFCGYDSDNVQHVYTWVVSRTKSFDSETMEKVKKIFDSTHFLDLNAVFWDHFDEKTCKVN